ncbi:hypothetical protein [Schleiferilactobacillus harbinensis]|uniref:hypothetical protein n=1 Tax=Schleiferilactobacillus harbinensis TaxID=304207 RepID=UPI0039E8AE4C
MKQKKKFYKRWWFWVIVAVAVVLMVVIPQMGNSDSGSSATTASSAKPSAQKVAKGSSTKKESKSSSTSDKTIDFDNAKHKVLTSATYPVQWSDVSWVGTQVKVDKALLIKVPPFKDDGDGKTYQGIVVMHFKITAARDINIYPTQGTLVTSDGQQAEADSYDSDDFDGAIAKGVTKDGYVAWELPKMDDPKAIKTLRVKFDANYDTDDMDDDNSSKTYDFTINL